MKVIKMRIIPIATEGVPSCPPKPILVKESNKYFNWYKSNPRFEIIKEFEVKKK